jgi:hypothetical protein
VLYALSAANEMDDLYCVTFGECCRVPLVPADDPSIDLNRQSFGFEIKQRKQTRDGAVVRDLPLLAVYFYSQEVPLSVEERLVGAYAFRIKCFNSPRPRLEFASMTIAAVPAEKGGSPMLNPAMPSLPARPI